MGAVSCDATLAAHLAAVRGLLDLRPLFECLGYAPAWEEIPLTRWLGPGHEGQVSRALVVAMQGGFRWFGVTGPNAEDAARQVLRALARRGMAGGVAAVAADGRWLALAVAGGECEIFAIDLAVPSRVALATLGRLRAAAGESALQTALRLADTLGSRGIGRRFFRQFRSTLDRFLEALPGRIPLPDRHALALLQLTRVLFLHFVQSKGWLDGRADFLRREVDGCLRRRRSVQRDLLRPLFFGTLNRRSDGRSYGARRFGRVPFLNGGLFEPHPLERRWPVDLPSPLWRDAFDDLFERFHFTVVEGAAGPAIAPDMLGRVFEGVMDPGQRHASGTFYTPAALVGELLDAAFAAFAGASLGLSDEVALARLEAGDPGATALLERVTLLDPAVGSGAFLLGAMEKLTRWRSLAGAPATAVRLKRDILRHNLFGVDLNAAAVRLTELRLWLGVIADDPADDPDHVDPLPNLDCLIRQGDSLLDPMSALSTAAVAASRSAHVVGELRRQVVGAVGDNKSRLARSLRTAEFGLLREVLTHAERRAEEDIAATLDAARSVTLFGDCRGLDRELGRQLEAARERRRRVRRARRQMEAGGELPWFHYQAHFADVFASRGGFDLVIGNPPWVRAEQLPRAVREALGKRYRWWRAGGERGYRHQPDLSLAFIERSCELAAPGGVVALLVPAKLATATYASAARHALSTETALHVLADLTSQREAAFDATVYPLALVTERRRPADGGTVRTALAPAAGADGVPQRRLREGPWILKRDDARSALDRLLARWPLLGARVSAHLGVKTGANAVFLDPPDDIEPAVIRRALRGRDVRPFSVQPSGRLLWPADEQGRTLARLPPRAAAHVARHHTLLEGRADQRDGPAWGVFRTRAATRPFRVVWADLARRLSAAVLAGPGERDIVPLNTCYVAPMPEGEAALRLAAWLNATPIRACARLLATPAASGFRRYNAVTVGRLPAPEALWDDAELLALGRSGRQGDDVQAGLDQAAARLLELRERDGHALAGVVGHEPARR